MNRSEQPSPRHGRGGFGRVRIDPRTLWSWAAAIAAAVIFFGASRGTQYHQLAVGMLLSCLTLLVLLWIVEVVWQALELVLDPTRRP